jgi:N-methylhydantoinase B
MTDIVDTTEVLARAEIRGLPQGEWEFTDYIDNDGIDMRPIAIKVKVKIDGDTVHVDFDGTSPQAKGSINPNIWYTKSCVYAAMKCLIDPSIQANSGFFRAFDIQAPEGCFVNPQHPAPVAARGLSGFRICQAIFGAMAQAMPGQVPGMWGGGEVGLSFGGYDKNRKGWVYLEFQNDGPRGGGPWMDGSDGAACAVNNLANTPIESVEADQPLLIERFAFVPDTGGAGQYRGGLAMTRDFRLLAEESMFQLRTDRHDFLPWGVEGGKPGTPTRNYLNPGTENEVELPGKHLTTLKQGDLYRLIQAGAGGFGDPLERDLDAIIDDVLEDKLTVDHVRQEYGVVVDPDTLELDMKATDELRTKMRRDRENGG